MSKSKTTREHESCDNCRIADGTTLIMFHNENWYVCRKCAKKMLKEKRRERVIQAN
jgi:hypothetical protein